VADAHFDNVIEGMRSVVEGSRGTARAIAVGAKYSIAGKSGTAQVVNIPQGARYDEDKLTEFQKKHALFIAFAPIENPKIAVAVVIENGGGGSANAAPVARKVMDYYLLDKESNELLPKFQPTVLQGDTEATLSELNAYDE